MSWPFDDPPNLGVITTVPVLEHGYPILLVTHDLDDGGWQFLCGTIDEPSLGRLVCLESILGIDEGMSVLADLPLGWLAWREDMGSPWRRELNPRSEEELSEQDDN